MPMHTSPGDSGRRILYVPIAQAGPGTTALVAPTPLYRTHIMGYVVVMSATGTVKFVDDDGDLTGAMTFQTGSGVSTAGNASSPLFKTGVNKTLSIVTTGGAANGHLSYFSEG